MNTKNETPAGERQPIDANALAALAAKDAKLAAPQTETARKEPDATCFRAGDWWLSPAGTRYRVVDANHHRAWLRKGGTGAQIARWLDAIGAHTSRPWVRESWGGQS